MSGRVDLRAPALAVVAWLASVGGLFLPPWVVLVALPLGGWSLARRRSDLPWVLGASLLVAGTAVFASASLQTASVVRGPVRSLAADGASVRVVAVVTSAPRAVHSRFSQRVVFDAEARDLLVRGRRFRLRSPILVVAPVGAALPRGTRVRIAGTLRTAEADDRAAVLSARSPPEVVSRAPLADRAAERVRRSIRDAVAGQPAVPAALVPALVDGEDGALPDAVVADFQASGLTHLLAVSGTNLTLMVGGLLILARRFGVRAHGLPIVGALGVVGFVLLAGPEPSVLRAAAMGSIALLGLGGGGRRRGVHWLGIAVWVLLLVQPRLAISPGFALSVTATAGILLLAPGWRAALAGWLPAWLADAVAVPLAAQVVCTPLVAAISGQVSLVAVAANLAAGPLVGPTTVLGLLGGVVGLVVPPLGALLARPAAWGAGAIVAVAHAGADLPVPTVTWGSGAVALVLLTAVCLGAAAVLGRVLARRAWALALAGLLTLVVLVPVPEPGWPPPGWVLVACSVGQGDALVLAAGSGAAFVVDAGPDPSLVDRCLRRLKIRAVPVVVLTHFHADHVDGLAGVLRHRRVGEIVTTPLEDPAGGARSVHRLAADAGIAVRTAVVGQRSSAGGLSWQVLAPTRTSYPDSDSPPNDASVVLLVEVRGIRILMMGDQERPSQAELRRTWPTLRADVLKVAHHGSSKQDADLVEGLGARLAVISVGAGNDYGHPAPSTLALLGGAGMRVRRTDLDGDVAVVVDGHGRLATVVRGTRGQPVGGGVGRP